jgi:hypothetical protein
MSVMFSRHVLIPSAGVKAGNRQDAKECLDFAARGLVKAHYQLRPMESLTEVSSTKRPIPVYYISNEIKGVRGNGEWDYKWQNSH